MLNNSNLDGKPVDLPETICFFGCTKIATSLTMLRLQSGHLALVVEINGLIQESLGSLVEINDIEKVKQLTVSFMMMQSKLIAEII